MQIFTHFLFQYTLIAIVFFTLMSFHTIFITRTYTLMQSKLKYIARSQFHIHPLLQYKYIHVIKRVSHCALPDSKDIHCFTVGWYTILFFLCGKGSSWACVIGELFRQIISSSVSLAINLKVVTFF